jgi:hypothetical protein
MKQAVLLLSILFITGISLLTSCSKDDNLEHYTYYKPVYKSKVEVRANIKSTAIRNVVQAGKIFIKDNYLFLVDVNRGVHVVDVTNISQPHKIAFIPIPGCVDIAVRGNFLYADCDKDLVTIDITNPAVASLKKVIPNIFPEKFYYNYYGYSADTTKMVADWIRVDTTYAKVNTQPNIYYAASSLSNSSTTTNGTGGSTSRFGLLNDRMYAVSNFDLKVFNTADAANPTFIKKTNMNQGNIETIFPYNNNLFIGSQSGMYIYDTSNPDNPAKLAQFTHVRSCDPVIADENTAYVTLHGGTSCGGFSNQLDVLDITSLTNPVFIKTYALTSPRGLAKDGKLLLICDGTAGLKIFSAADASNIILLKQVSNMDAQDVITYKNTAIVTTAKGLYFVDYQNIMNAKITAIIPVDK